MIAASTPTLPDLGPAAPMPGGFPGSSGRESPAPARGYPEPFLPARGAWYGLQRYVSEILLLPDALPAAGEPGALWVALAEIYAAVRGCCRNWRDQTFPASVGLADAVVQYAMKVPNYYGALGDLLAQLCRPAADDDAELRAEIRDIIDELRGEVRTAADHARQVNELIGIFQAAIGAARDDLRPRQEPASLEGWYDVLDGRAQSLAIGLERLRYEADALNRDYEHNVVAAATAPAYAWAPPIGLLAGPIAAGSYGAAGLVRRLDAARPQRSNLDGASQAALDSLLAIGALESRLDGLLALLEPALAATGAIEGIWRGLLGHLAALDDALDGIGEACQGLIRTFCLRLGEAIDQWRTLAYAADHYRANAFIKVPAALAQWPGEERLA